MAVVSKNHPAPDLVRSAAPCCRFPTRPALWSLPAVWWLRRWNWFPRAAPARLWRRKGLAVRDVSDLTGFPEIMDGRVKTLHPGVHGGLLSIRDDEEHRRPCRPRDCGDRSGGNQSLSVRGNGGRRRRCGDNVENIDIGGPAMIRASAKNHAYVTAVTDPAIMGGCSKRCAVHDGAVPLALRQASWRRWPLPGPRPMTQRFPDGLPPNLRWKHRGTVPLAAGCLTVMRYGENPHQAAAFYTNGEQRPGVAGDTSAGQAAVLQQHQRHRCGIRAGQRIRSGPGGLRHHQACQSVRRGRGRQPGGGLWPGAGCDQTSAFGGIIALNQHARRGDGDGNRQDVHRSHHCPGRQRGSDARSCRPRRTCG
jgi:phosphoribosylaminoimidazolecarboxamide formyltransferase/IMP cyclohydrolase